jgi:hypothetical protein
MKLTKYEQETVILWNNDTDRADIYTCDSKLKRKLQSFLDEKNHDVVREKENEYSLTCSIPKKWIRIQKPRSLSEKQRKELTLRMKRLNTDTK